VLTASTPSPPTLLANVGSARRSAARGGRQPAPTPRWREPPWRTSSRRSASCSWATTTLRQRPTQTAQVGPGGRGLPPLVQVPPARVFVAGGQPVAEGPHCLVLRPAGYLDAPAAMELELEEQQQGEQEEEEEEDEQQEEAAAALFAAPLQQQQEALPPPATAAPPAAVARPPAPVLPAVAAVIAASAATPGSEGEGPACRRPAAGCHATTPHHPSLQKQQGTHTYQSPPPPHTHTQRLKCN
jgi:hypothetical protein